MSDHPGQSLNEEARENVGAGTSEIDPDKADAPDPAAPHPVETLTARAEEAARLKQQDDELRGRSVRLTEMQSELHEQGLRLEQIGAAAQRNAETVDAVEARIRLSQSGGRERREAFGVADVSKGMKDMEGRAVEEVYARKSGAYAVYKVKDGDVWIQLSDTVEEADKQRAALGRISVLRWDIDRLADDWTREAHYHRELASGLQLALQFHEQEAQDKLTRVLDGLRQERAIAGRVQYMVYAAGTALLMLVALYVFSEKIYPFESPTTNVWLASKGGLVGAFLSIAISIRSRTVALDNDRKSNALEGALRLSIGVIAGGFLLLAIGSGFLTRIVAGDVTATGQIANWQAVVILGFIGGFVERLVPSLLEKAQPQSAAQGAAQGASRGQQKPT